MAHWGQGTKSSDVLGPTSTRRSWRGASFSSWFWLSKTLSVKSDCRVSTQIYHKKKRNSKPSLPHKCQPFKSSTIPTSKIKTKHQFLAQPMTRIMAGITAGRGDTTLPLLSAGRPGDAGGRVVDGSDFFPSNRRSTVYLQNPSFSNTSKAALSFFIPTHQGYPRLSLFPGTYVKEMKSSIKSHQKFQVPSAPVLP